MTEFRDRNVLVIGLGRSGLGAARLLSHLGARVTVSELRPETKGVDLPEGVRIVTGPHREELLDGTDMVVVSPGVPTWIEILREANRRGVEVVSEIEVAYRCTEVLGIPWVCVTGTNGKTTTTTMISEMLRAAGHDILTGGNIGVAMTELVLERLQAGGLDGVRYVVAEVSSFQLETIRRLRPYVAVLLNITPDHQDRYPGPAEYREAKLRLFMNQTPSDRAVLNYDQLREVSRACPSQVYFFSRTEEVRGAFLRDGLLWLNTDLLSPILEAKEMGVRGTHNIENALAASVASYLCGAGLEDIRRVLKGFKGLPHRLEYVATVRGVDFYNDSKATNMDSVLKSVEGFGGGVILILGGKDKGADFSELLRVKSRLKAIVAIGEARRKILSQLGPHLRVYEATGMGDAIGICMEVSQDGDVVLLSPGCASFDMYRDYEHRGDDFKEKVRSLQYAVKG